MQALFPLHFADVSILYAQPGDPNAQLQQGKVRAARTRRGEYCALDSEPSNVIDRTRSWYHTHAHCDPKVHTVRIAG